MANEFDPVLKKQLAIRKRERMRELATIEGQAKLKHYLQQRGLNRVSQDPSLTHLVPTKPIS